MNSALQPLLLSLTFINGAGTTIILITTLLLLLLTLHHLQKTPKTNKAKQPPTASGAWPIMGHLHKLRGPDLPHRVLASMADRYGPIFTIKLGPTTALVISNRAVAKKCFTTNDLTFSSRPTTVATKLMCYNNTMFGFAPYGPYWREVRKVVMVELLSTRRLELLKHIWASEINVSVKDLVGYWSRKACNGSNGDVVVEMSDWFGQLTLNIGLRLVVGKSCDDMGSVESERCLSAMREYPELLGRFLLEDALPWLGRFDVHGNQREMRRAARVLDEIIDGWLDEHKRNRGLSGGGDGHIDQDFMDLMLSVLDQDQDSSLRDHDADMINKSTCLNLILGMTDTTMVTLTWAISLLLNNRPALKKVQEELKAQVGNDRHVDESDVKNLVYLQAVIKEVLRLYPPEPLSGPRETLQDCEVAGYHVPRGTRLIVNLWKIHRDPSTWEDPMEFRPERFLMKHRHVDVWGQQHFEFMPFGSGRRSCPGVSFEVQVLPLILARLIHSFEMTTRGNAPVDMSERPGLVISKASPLEVVISPRLPLHLFN
ncbi:hypothetical protein Sjap_017084 [Stephania japonica]|uniref:Cytochrome P450 n=1 Tax=Stephania japonica TaxID=461633 RepID=A0AAP0I5H9_9MAGN